MARQICIRICQGVNRICHHATARRGLPLRPGPARASKHAQARRGPARRGPLGISINLHHALTRSHAIVKRDYHCVSVGVVTTPVDDLVSGARDRRGESCARISICAGRDNHAIRVLDCLRFIVLRSREVGARHRQAVAGAGKPGCQVHLVQ